MSGSSMSVAEMSAPPVLDVPEFFSIACCACTRHRKVSRGTHWHSTGANAVNTHARTHAHTHTHTHLVEQLGLVAEVLTNEVTDCREPLPSLECWSKSSDELGPPPTHNKTYARQGNSARVKSLAFVRELIVRTCVSSQGSAISSLFCPTLHLLE